MVSIFQYYKILILLLLFYHKQLYCKNINFFNVDSIPYTFSKYNIINTYSNIDYHTYYNRAELFLGLQVNYNNILYNSDNFTKDTYDHIINFYSSENAKNIMNLFEFKYYQGYINIYYQMSISDKMGLTISLLKSVDYNAFKNYMVKSLVVLYKHFTQNIEKDSINNNTDLINSYKNTLYELSQGIITLSNYNSVKLSFDYTILDELTLQFNLINRTYSNIYINYINYVYIDFGLLISYINQFISIYYGIKGINIISFISKETQEFIKSEEAFSSLLEQNNLVSPYTGIVFNLYNMFYIDSSINYTVQNQLVQYNLIIGLYLTYHIYSKLHFKYYNSFLYSFIIGYKTSYFICDVGFGFNKTKFNFINLMVSLNYTEKSPNQDTQRYLDIILIDINKASLSELQKLPNITRNRAINIIKYRNRTKFYTILDIMHVKGISYRVYKSIRDLITIGNVDSCLRTRNIKYLEVRDYIGMGLDPSKAIRLTLFYKNSKDTNLENNSLETIKYLNTYDIIKINRYLNSDC